MAEIHNDDPNTQGEKVRSYGSENAFQKDSNPKWLTVSFVIKGLSFTIPNVYHLVLLDKAL